MAALILLLLLLSACATEQPVRAPDAPAGAAPVIDPKLAVCDSLERQAKTTAPTCWQQTSRSCVKDEAAGRQLGDCPACDELDELETALRRNGCMQTPQLSKATCKDRCEHCLRECPIARVA